MDWIYLIFAGFCEILWPVGFKISQQGYFVRGIILAIVGMGISGFFLWLAQKSIPIGTAYIVWTGIGGIGTFIVGIYFFGDPTSIMKYLGAIFVITGIIILKVA